MPEEYIRHISLAVQLKDHVVTSYYDFDKELKVIITPKSGLRGNSNFKLYNIGEIEAIHEVLGQIIQDDDLNMQEKLDVPIGEEPF